MLKSLKYKMLGTIMFFVTIIILAFLLVVNVVPSRRSYQEAISFLNQKILPPIAPPPTQPQANTPPDDSPFPNSEPPNLPKNKDSMLFHSNLIFIYLDSNHTMTRWNSNRQDLYEETTISEYAKTITSQNKREGTLSGYYYVYRPALNFTSLPASNSALTSDSDSISYSDLKPDSDSISNSALNSASKSSGVESVIVLLDNRIAFHNLQTVLLITLGSGLLVWVLLFILSAVIVNRMTYPIAETFEKQKQFISDAGHELKTPVAVISANTEVLTKEIGENKWLSYIQTETKRMDHLIKNLMTIAQIDDSDKKFIHTPIDLSQTLLGAALPFESLAFENGTIMEFDISPNLQINGNKEQIEQLVVVLLSNAIKYGEPRGLIRICLWKKHKSIYLSIYNTGAGIPLEETDKIFERFYRVEKERSRKDGHYGLGLAIAKSIVSEHHGKISVDSEYGKNATFTIEFNENK